MASTSTPTSSAGCVRSPPTCPTTPAPSRWRRGSSWPSWWPTPGSGTGIDPAASEAAAALVPILDAFRGDRPDSPELRAELADRFAVGTDRRVERYWELLGVINGWGSFPRLTPAFEWTIAALRAHPAPLA